MAALNRTLEMTKGSFLKHCVIATDEAARIFIELAKQADCIEDDHEYSDVSRLLESGWESLNKRYSR